MAGGFARRLAKEVNTLLVTPDELGAIIADLAEMAPGDRDFDGLCLACVKRHHGNAAKALALQSRVNALFHLHMASERPWWAVPGGVEGMSFLSSHAIAAAARCRLRLVGGDLQFNQIEFNKAAPDG